MPYITQDLRKDFDPLIEELQGLISQYDISDRKGITNYVISRIVAGGMKPTNGWGYTSLSNAISVFEDAGSEMRRRLLDPYEDKKIRENGSIKEYPN